MGIRQWRQGRPFAALISYIGYATTPYVWLPLSIQAGMGCVIFLYIGYCIRQGNWFEGPSVPLAAKLGMAALWLFCIVYGGKLYMVYNTYENGLLDGIGAICGTFMIVYLSQFIEKRIPLLGRFMANVGRASLGILCAHLITINCQLQNFAARFTGGIGFLPGWLANVIHVTAASLAVALILYGLPLTSSIFFPGSKTSGFYKGLLKKWGRAAVKEKSE